MSFYRTFPALLTPLAAAMPAVAQQQAVAEHPNIVVIVADDMGTNEIGCYGGKNITTPNINRLAEEGIRMTNTCTPRLFPEPQGHVQNGKKHGTLPDRPRIPCGTHRQRPSDQSAESLSF